MTKEVFLLEAIKINEQVVRSMDVKAQVFLAAILFGAANIGGVLTLTGGRLQFDNAMSSFLIATILLAVLLQMYVVSPTTIRISSGMKIFYAAAPLHKQDVEQELSDLNVTAELIDELVEITRIRIIKSRRTRLATWATMVLIFSFGVVLLFARVFQV